jgi:hypothetical protein
MRREDSRLGDVRNRPAIFHVLKSWNLKRSCKLGEDVAPRSILPTTMGHIDLRAGSRQLLGSGIRTTTILVESFAEENA